MHFTCEKQALKVAIDQAYRAVGSSANMPILSHICLEAKGDRLELIATDLNIGIISKMEVKGIEDGSTAVLADSLKKIIDSFDLGEVELELNARGMLIISTKNSRYELPTLPSNEFPTPKVPETKCFFNILGKDLSYMMTAVKFAAADASSTRVNMQSVLFDIKGGRLIMVSTDGKRMAKIEHSLNDEDIEDIKVIVPKMAIDKLIGLLSADKIYRVDICEKQIYFSNVDMMFNCSIIDANYPDYTRFFSGDNEGKSRCNIDRVTLSKSLKRVSLMAREKTNLDLVEFSFSTDTLTLSSNSASVGSGMESVAIYNEGEPLNISFNCKYIIDVLDALNCEQIEIDLKDSNSGVMIRPLESKDYDYICMPMRR